MWFTETAWPPMLIFITLGIACGLQWIRTSRTGYLAGVMLMVVAAGMTWHVEQAVVTEAEVVAQAITDVTQAFEERDVSRTLDFFSQQLHPLVELAFSRVKSIEGLRITDVSVEMLAQNSRARSHFRANGTVAVESVGDIGHQPSRWELTWQKEAGQWKIIKIQRLNPITGEPINLWAGNS